MGYAYNFNPNYPYQRPQSMGAANGFPYARPARPASSRFAQLAAPVSFPYNQPITPVASPYGRPIIPTSPGGFSTPRLNMPMSGTAAPHGFLTPQPGLPTPSQVLNPAMLQGSPQTGFATNAASIAEKPQIQNHYYTVTNGKEPASKRKNIKKFLLTTGAVVAGMFTTIGVAAGLLWFFYPGFIQLGQAIGGKNAQAAAKALSEWKKPGDLLTRFNNARKAFAQCKLQDAEHHNKSPYQRLKNWLFGLFQSEEQKLKAKTAKPSETAAQTQDSEAPVSDMLKEVENIFAQVPQEHLKALEEKATQMGAKCVSTAMASPENQEILKGLLMTHENQAWLKELLSKTLTESLSNADNQKILQDLMAKSISENLSGLPLIGRFCKK